MKRHLSLDDVQSENCDIDDIGDFPEGWTRKVNKRSKGKSIPNKSKTTAAKNASLSTKLVVEMCVKCSTDVPSEKALKCEYCSDYYHPDCGGCDAKVFENFKPILLAIGWTCSPCKADLPQLLSKARAEAGERGMVTDMINPITDLGQGPAVDAPPSTTTTALAISTALLENRGESNTESR